MKINIITARYFAQHASAIGKHLEKNPDDIYFVSNKTDPKKNFICVSRAYFTSNIRPEEDVMRVLLTQERSVHDRRQRSTKMSRSYWDGDKIGLNENKVGRKMEKVSSIVINNKRYSAVRTIASNTKDMEIPRRRSKRLVYKVSTIRTGK